MNMYDWRGICGLQKSLIQKSKVLSEVAVKGSFISLSESNSTFPELCGSTEGKKVIRQVFPVNPSCDFC